MTSKVFPELNKPIELHTHSTVSDGVYSPRQLAQLCVRKEVGLWSLTDHDTCAGWEEAYGEARERGVSFLPGIEISAQVKGRSIHVLGYGFNPRSPAIEAYGARMDGARFERMEAIVAKVVALGFRISIEDVLAESERGNIGRPHLARAMEKKGHVATVQEAFDLYLAEDRPAYVAMKWLEVDEAIELIARAGGCTILAHPARYEHLDSYLPGWAAQGLAGLEVRHPSHDLADEERLGRLAEANGLIKTASSDFHGGGRDGDDRFGVVNFPHQWRESFADVLKDTVWDGIDPSILVR